MQLCFRFANQHVVAHCSPYISPVLLMMGEALEIRPSHKTRPYILSSQSFQSKHWDYIHQTPTVDSRWVRVALTHNLLEKY